MEIMPGEYLYFTCKPCNAKRTNLTHNHIPEVEYITNTDANNSIYGKLYSIEYNITKLLINLILKCIQMKLMFAHGYHHLRY